MQFSTNQNPSDFWQAYIDRLSASERIEVLSHTIELMKRNLPIESDESIDPDRINPIEYFNDRWLSARFYSSLRTNLPQANPRITFYYWSLTSICGSFDCNLL